MSEKKEINEGNIPVHVFLQGKGGAGKTTCAVLLTQYLASKGSNYMAIDLDPVNNTFAQYVNLEAVAWDILDDQTENDIDPVKFDEVMTKVMESQNSVVIDTGASSFISFNNYLITTGIAAILEAAGKTLHLHCVLRAGASTLDCLNGLKAILSQHDDSVRVYAWLNEAEGNIAHDGKNFEEMKVYRDYKARIAGIIRINQVTDKLQAAALVKMLKEHKTFEEIETDSSFNIFEKSRLSKLQEEFFHRLRIVF